MPESIANRTKLRKRRAEKQTYYNKETFNLSTVKAMIN